MFNTFNTLIAVWCLANQRFNASIRDCCSGGESMNLLFNSNIVSLPLKINGGGCRKPNFVILPIGALELSAGRWSWRDGQGFI